MFSKSKGKGPSRNGSANGAGTAIISADMRIKGDLVSEGEVQIDGHVEGDVRCRSLTVGPTGEIKGEVEVDEARLHGSMIGQLRANSVFLANSARMVGDVYHESLAIEPGAFVDGHCRHRKMLEENKVLSPPPAKEDAEMSDGE